MIKNKKYLCFYFLWAMLLLGGCATPQTFAPIDAKQTTIEKDGYKRVHPIGEWIVREIDREAGVVCYVTHDGISCLPIISTNLPQ